ncbi:MAG: hypothetical protein V7644_2433, partial [Actinomycetota bacterium]
TLAELAAPARIPPPEGVPPNLARLVMRCLAEEPAARPPSAAELAHELAALLPDGRTLALPDHPSQRATQILAPRETRPRRPRATLVLAAVAVAAVLAGAAAALALGFGSGSGESGSGRTVPLARVAPVPHAVTAQEQARAIAAWLRRHSR